MSGGAAGVMLAFLAVTIPFIFIAASNQQKRRKQVLRELGKRLGGGSDERSAWGEIAGTFVKIVLTTRGSGKTSQNWTEIAAESPSKYPLAFFLRKHGWSDRAAIEKGELVDVVVGDPEFDKKFIVEAAPADVARVLLHDRAREYLLSLSYTYWLEIKTHGSVLRLDVRTWLDTIEEAMPAIEAITSIASKVREAYRIVEAATPPEDTGTPYRPMLDDTRAREAAEARLEEVRHVGKLRVEREARQQLVAVMAVFGFLILAVVAMVLSR